ncbi:MAG: OmpA family protein [Chitinophagaceae bacterium]
MRKLYLTLLSLIAFFSVLNAQNQHGIGVHFAAYDFFGPQGGTYLYNNYDLNTISSKNKTFFYDPAVKVSYWKKINRFFDFSTALHISSLYYPNAKNDSVYFNYKRWNTGLKKDFPYFALDAKVCFNLLSKERYILAPYLAAGFNASCREKTLGFSAPLGLGTHIKLSKNLFFNLESQYHMPLAKNTQTHLVHSAGIIYWWGQKSAKEPKPIKTSVPKIVDTDGDGVPDAQDECKDQAGLAALKGCPDTDGDGIADNRDACPQVAGKLNGCPDSDNDGIKDSDDQCPTVKGIVKYRGCPIPDSDNDDINDEVDQCPHEYAKTQNGCPEIQKEVVEKVIEAAKGINFETGKANLTAASFKNLDKVVEILLENLDINVDIEGHTDNQGNAEKNMFLSQQRAEVCKNYLIKKGIQAIRITSTGFGDINPIADNSTPEGRAKNRRTEFILSK